MSPAEAWSERLPQWEYSEVRDLSMGERDTFDRILGSLHEAALDEARFPRSLCPHRRGVAGKGEFAGVRRTGRPPGGVQIFYAGFFYRGERSLELERKYFEVYYPRDERIPRLRDLPDGQLVHCRDLYTDEELKRSPAYNEALSLAPVARYPGGQPGDGVPRLAGRGAGAGGRPWKRTPVDPGLVGSALGLSQAESRVAALLAEGKTVSEIAAATGRKVSTIRTHVQHIFAKHGINRQVDLVRLVLSKVDAPRPRR